jgi:TPR repeat protein
VGQAVEWLRKAADQGCARAQFELAQQYACGNGEPRSTAETPVALFTRSAKAGWMDARLALGERYRVGLGVEANRAHAFFWYNLAATQESRAAIEQQEKLKGSLTTDDYRQIARWSEELKSR